MQDGEDFQTRGRKKKQSDFMQEAEPSFWGGKSNSVSFANTRRPDLKVIKYLFI